MSFLDGLRYKLNALLRRERFERELDDEMRFHKALDAGQTGSGDSGLAARRFGNETYIKEEVRRMSWLGLIDTIAQDVRFAVRTFVRRRSFTAAALLTTGLGVGAATAIYSVADGVLFRPLPFPGEDRIVTIWRTRPEVRGLPEFADRWDHGTVSLPEYADLRAQGKAFSQIALYTSASLSVTFDNNAESLNGYLASASLLPVLGVTPALGRNFTEAEDQVGGAPVTLVSYPTWTNRYGASPAVLGQTVNIDGKSYVIVGVLPKDLALGRSQAVGAFWIPAGQDAVRAAQRGYHDFLALGRLAPGATLESATAQAQHVFETPGAQATAAAPAPGATTTRTNTNSHDSPTVAGAHLAMWREDATRLVRKPILILLGASALLLTIACVNVATLLLGEAAKRQPEMAARLALGAGRGRLVRQLLAESLTISFAGALLGVLLASWGVRVLVRLAPNGVRIPGLRDVGVDTRVLLATGLVAVLTGVLFGLAPAVSLSSSATLTPRGRGVTKGRGSLQQWFIGAQVALSVVLLVGAGLLGRSFAKLTAVAPGFNPTHLMEVDVALPPSAYPDQPSVRAFLEDATERLAALPGVTGAGATAGWTFGSSNHSSDYQVEGRPEDPSEHTNAERRGTTPGFFSLTGVRLVAGRAYTADDWPETPPVIVISEALAHRAFGGASPLGQRIVFMGRSRTVIGVAADVKFQRLSNDDPGTIYGPLSQICCFSPTVLVRVTGDPADAALSIRGAVKQIAPQATVQNVTEMSNLIRNSYADERYRTTLITIFAAVSAVLAALGLYGVATRAVAQRLQEVAIRLALGATSGSVMGLVLRRTLSGVAIGVGVGAIAALLTTRVLTPYLFGVTTSDPAVYTGIVVLLAVVSLAASWLPARRATRVEPVEVLRAD
ncbi:MAG TPA: ABC transporter permease [Gemmatimonadales bacterium]|jgi:predicted permease